MLRNPGRTYHSVSILVTVSDNADFPSRLAEICFDAADLVLFDLAKLDAQADPNSPWAMDRQSWLRDRATEEPISWLHEAAASYLLEAANQVRAVGTLLLTHVVAAALDPLVRAVFERVARIKWLLDVTATPEQRGARAGLELGVSLSSYRRALDLDRSVIPVSVRTTLRDQVRAHRAKLEELFEVKRPPSGCNPAELSTDMAEWLVAGESYPNYSDLAKYMQNPNFTGKQAALAYAGMCGFAHPSVLFSRETRVTGPDGRWTIESQPADLEKYTRLAAMGLLEAALYWTTYFGADPGGFVLLKDALIDRMDDISISLHGHFAEAEDGSDGPEPAS